MVKQFKLNSVDPDIKKKKKQWTKQNQIWQTEDIKDVHARANWQA